MNAIVFSILFVGCCVGTTSNKASDLDRLALIFLAVVFLVSACLLAITENS